MINADDHVIQGAENLFEDIKSSLTAPLAKRYQDMIDWYNESSLLEFVAPVGTRMENVQLTDHNHQPLPLADIVQSGPAVILFFRGEWCGFCNYYVRKLNQAMGMFKDGGARFYAVTPDTCFSQQEWQEMSESDFHIVSDPKHNIARQFGLVYEVPDRIYRLMLDLGVDIVQRNGNKNLPLTGVFIIDENGEIAWKDVGQDFRYRTTPEEILAAISGTG